MIEKNTSEEFKKTNVQEEDSMDVYNIMEKYSRIKSKEIKEKYPQRYKAKNTPKKDTLTEEDNIIEKNKVMHFKNSRTVHPQCFFKNKIKKNKKNKFCIIL